VELIACIGTRGVNVNAMMNGKTRPWKLANTLKIAQLQFCSGPTGRCAVSSVAQAGSDDSECWDLDPSSLEAVIVHVLLCSE